MKKSKVKLPNTNKTPKSDLLNTVSKTISDSTGMNLNGAELDSMSRQMLDVNTMVDDIVELNPKIELVVELMTSLIKSPNDGDTDKINLSLNNSELPSSVKSILTDVIERHITTEYNIIDKLDDIISQSLYTHGSYVEINIPSPFVKELVSNIKKSPKAGTESLYRAIDVKHANSGTDFFTDNLTPLVLDSIAIKETVKKSYSKYSNSIFGNNTKAGIENSIYGDMAILSNYDLSIDLTKPIIKKVPSYKIIPIANKSNPSEHYGYFYIVDDKNSSYTNNVHDTSYLESKMKNIKTYGQAFDDNVKITNIDELRNYIVENKLKTLLNNKYDIDKIDTSIDISNSLLLDIADNLIEKNNLKIIFLPTELVSYYAYKYRDNGTGKGLIERVSTLASIKGILTFVNLLAYVKSNITTTTVNIDLDEDDVEHRTTVNKILSEVIKNRQFNLPIRMLKVDNFIDWTHKLGFAVNAKHPDFPDINVDISEEKNDIEPIDSDLFENIDKDIITSLYCTPEIIDDSYSANFATTVRQNYFLLNKRINNLQKHYNKQITSDISKKLLIDGNIAKQVIDVIVNNIKDVRKYIKKNDGKLDKDIIARLSDDDLAKQLTYLLFKNVSITLQKPLKAEDVDIMDKFGSFTDKLDTVMDAMFSDDAIPDELLGDLSGKLDNIKSAFKTTLIRTYLNDNNILPEFTKAFTLDENGKANTLMLDEFNNYLETLKELALPFIKDNIKITKKTDKLLDKIENPSEDDLEDDNDNNATDDNTEDNNTTDDTGDNMGEEL